MKKIGIKQVAEKAGVSVATVSYVMSGNSLGKVSKDTVDHVLEVARNIGFVRNEAAARLRSGQSKMLGVILNNIVNPFFSSLVAALEAEAYRAGFVTLLGTAQNDHDRQSQLLHSMVSQGVGAIILSPVHETVAADLDVVQSRGIPVVSCVRDVLDSTASFVGVDDHKAGYIAATELLRAGCQDALFIGGYGNTTTWEGRLKGMQQAFARFGLNPGRILFEPGPLTSEFGHSTIKSYFDKGDLPRGIFAFNDNLATGIYAAGRQLGLEFGRDLSIVSFDNVSLSTILSPELTTIDIFPAKIGSLSAQRAIEMVLTGSRERKEIVLDPELCPRSSV